MVKSLKTKLCEFGRLYHIKIVDNAYGKFNNAIKKITLKCNVRSESVARSKTNRVIKSINKKWIHMKPYLIVERKWREVIGGIVKTRKHFDQKEKRKTRKRFKQKEKVGRNSEKNRLLGKERPYNKSLKLNDLRENEWWKSLRNIQSH